MAEKLLLTKKKKIEDGNFEYHFVIVKDGTAGKAITLVAKNKTEAYAQAGISKSTNLIEKFVAAPVEPISPGDPQPATKADIAAIVTPLAKSLADVAANWKDSCILNNTEPNNCAHFLSDAFIRAGYTELLQNTPGRAAQISIWCDYNGTKNAQARAIRAREMNEWFKTKSKISRTSRPENSGYWAVFQLDESVYWGGHVLLLDSDKNIFFGTGAHWNWPNQFFYQW